MGLRSERPFKPFNIVESAPLRNMGDQGEKCVVLFALREGKNWYAYAKHLQRGRVVHI